MLTLKEVIGVKWGVGNRWGNIDVADYPVNELLSRYRVIQIAAVDDMGRWCYYRLTDNMDKFGYYQGTVTELINLPGVEFVSTGITLCEKRTNFISMSSYGYRFELVDDNNVSSIESGKSGFVGDNLRVVSGMSTPTGLDINELASAAMFSINGHYHRPKQLNGSVLIKDGGKTFKRSGRYQNALWDFTQLGGIRYSDIPLDTLVLKGNILEIGLHENVKDKFAMLVFMGYPIYVDENVLSTTGPGAYELDLTKIDLLGKYKEARDYIDISQVSSLLQTHPQKDTDLITIDILRAILSLSQSFWVIVNSGACFVNTEKLKFLNSGLYEYRGINKGPIRHGFGRHPDYSWSGSSGIYYLSVGGVTDITTKKERESEMVVLGSDY